MSDRPLVITFEEDEDTNEVGFNLERSQYKQKRLSIKSGDPDLELLSGNNINVRKAGEKLRDALLQHTGINDHLSGWLSDQNRAYKAFHLNVKSLSVDKFPWEALVDKRGIFLSLDGSASITRVLAAEQDMIPTRQALFIPPLRIACILGAWWENDGISLQEQEWSSLQKAFQTEAAQELGLDILVLGCYSTLKERVENASIGKKIKITWKPITESGFNEDILTFKPHILHIYGHGMPGEYPYVAIRTVANVDESAEPTVCLTSQSIRQNLDLNENTWVVALNCCDTAAPGAQAESVGNLARELVGYGFPAVTGMRAAVKTGEARLLTEHFYQAVFDALNKLAPGTEKEVEWADFMLKVRLALAGDLVKAAKSSRWLLPVLYARLEPFSIQRNKEPTNTSKRRGKKREALQFERDELSKQLEGIMQSAISDEDKGEIKKIFDKRIQDIDKQLR
jgi:hypothetical protein